MMVLCRASQTPARPRPPHTRRRARDDRRHTDTRPSPPSTTTTARAHAHQHQHMHMHTSRHMHALTESSTYARAHACRHTCAHACTCTHARTQVMAISLMTLSNMGPTWKTLMSVSVCAFVHEPSVLFRPSYSVCPNPSVRAPLRPPVRADPSVRPSACLTDRPTD